MSEVVIAGCGPGKEYDRGHLCAAGLKVVDLNIDEKSVLLPEGQLPEQWAEATPHITKFP